MTTLEKNVPYKCKYKVSNGFIVTICDTQCDFCKRLSNEKTSKDEK